MEMLNDGDYNVLNQYDAERRSQKASPVFKVRMYGDLLREIPLGTVFIHIVKAAPSVNGKMAFYENCIPAILRKLEQKVFAYENELIC